MAVKNRMELRQVRHARVRKRVEGSAARPRLAVFRSTKHISAQIIDDLAGHTLVSVSTLEKGLGLKGGIDGAKRAGLELAKRAKEQGITEVVFDRGGFRYHGQVASLANGAREGGLNF